MQQIDNEFDPMGARIHLLENAADGESVAWIALRPFNATLRPFSWCKTPKQSERQTGVSLHPLSVKDAAELYFHGSCMIKTVLATDPSDKTEHPWKDHYWELKEPQSVVREQVYFQRITPAAKVDGWAAISPSGEGIPGKMPNTAIGKLAIKAAWRIECETHKCATAKLVISKLQEMTATEPELAETIPHGVKWTTTKGKEKPFDVEACAKALEKWNTSRA